MYQQINQMYSPRPIKYHTALPSQHETLNQWWVNVGEDAGPALTHHWMSVTFFPGVQSDPAHASCRHFQWKWDAIHQVVSVRSPGGPESRRPLQFQAIRNVHQKKVVTARQCVRMCTKKVSVTRLRTRMHTCTQCHSKIMFHNFIFQMRW